MGLATIAERCRRAFALPSVPLLRCNRLSTPATIGFRKPVVLLPESFFTSELSEDDLASALSHEFAHIRRRDFLLNLIYEVISLPLSFHPFTAFIKSRIAHTRELACDDMAACILPSNSCYASSLLHITQLLPQAAESRYALGLFDTNSLEERIVNLLKIDKASGQWARAVRMAGVCMVGAAALAISVFSLKAAENTSDLDLEQFRGTWECKYKGRAFFILKMDLKNGMLGGTALHSKRVAWVNGELIPATDETTRDKIVETHASGQELILQTADGADETNLISFSFKLVGNNEAEARLITEKQSSAPPSAPPREKPWHFERVSNAQ